MQRSAFYYQLVEDVHLQLFYYCHNNVEDIETLIIVLLLFALFHFCNILKTVPKLKQQKNRITCDVSGTRMYITI